MYAKGRSILLGYRHDFASGGPLQTASFMLKEVHENQEQDCTRSGACISANMRERTSRSINLEEFAVMVGGKARAIL